MIPSRTPAVLSRVLSAATTSVGSRPVVPQYTAHAGQPFHPPYTAGSNLPPQSQRPYSPLPYPLPSSNAPKEENAVLKALASFHSAWDSGPVTGTHNEVKCVIASGNMQPFPFTNKSGKLKDNQNEGTY
jgi:hypothetical protein